MSFWRQARKIVCIGRNFADHAKELGNKVPTAPFFFLKPTSSILPNKGQIEIPKGCQVHHEVELGLIIGKTGRDIPETEAMSHISGYCVALDMTARNLQDEAKAKAHPWSTAKGFDTFTPLSEFIPKEKIPDPHSVQLWLKVDGKLVQNGNTRDMIFHIPRLVSHVSSIMTLEQGDIILTGTPSGVGPVKSGQQLVGGVKLNPAQSDSIMEMQFKVIDRRGTGQYSMP